MRSGLIWAVLLLLILQGSAGASSIVRFEDGSMDAVAGLSGPGYTTVLRFDVPAKCHILNATLNVSAMAPNASCPGWPEDVQVLLEDDVVWEFNGSVFGGLGMQDSFSNGASARRFEFNTSGWMNATSLRLPKNATVLTAVMEMGCSGPGALQQLVNFTGAAATDHMGGSVSGAGDLNNDGYDDVVVGAMNNDSGASNAGRAYVHFGGPGMDNVSDLVLTGEAEDNYFGSSVAGAGDLNGDGYDDLVVSAPGNNAAGSNAGRAYIFRGGANMDGAADVVLTGAKANDTFGRCVVGARDVNGDGYDDVMVGAPANNSKGNYSGSAYIFFGGAQMDSQADVNFTGSTTYDWFGSTISGAGDVNGDGYDDVVVGVTQSIAGGSGRAFVFFGGAAMDNLADVTLAGEAVRDAFGLSVSGAGDINRDGYDDVVVGAGGNDAGGQGAGRAYIFFGGAAMDAVADVTFTGEAADDYFGGSVSGAGDANRDGYDDVVVAATGNDTAGPNAGRVYVFFGGPLVNGTANTSCTGEVAQDQFGNSVAGAGDVDQDGFCEVIIGAFYNDAGGTTAGRAYILQWRLGILAPGLLVGNKQVVRMAGCANGTCSTQDFSGVLNSYIGKAGPAGIDDFGNAYVEIPVCVTAMSAGNVSIGGLNITYDYNSTTVEFADELNKYIADHGSEADVFGNVSVPIMVRASSPGRLRLGELNIVYDGAPILVRPIPDAVMDEDTVADRLVDLHQYFSDNDEGTGWLRFGIVSATNDSIVEAWILGNRYVSIDARGGLGNDDWTGTVDIVVNCSDKWGNTAESNIFRVTVQNVPDSPVIFSSPPRTGVAGEQYVYYVLAKDADGDALTFGLEANPPNMTINLSTGGIFWTPLAGGNYNVSVFVTDGVFKAYQNYSVAVPNRPPRIAGNIVPDAYVGKEYIYDLSAADPDGDALKFTLVPRAGSTMSMDSPLGRLTWVPGQPGVFPVTVLVSDGQATITYDFNITVKLGNHAPRFLNTTPKTAIVGLPFVLDTNARDDDGDLLAYTLAVMPPGMSINASTGEISWIPDAAGTFKIMVEAADGRGGTAQLEVNVTVSDRERPQVLFNEPSVGEKVRGKVTVSGFTVRGTLEVVMVQIRVDAGEWTNATGNSSWESVLDTSRLRNGKHTLLARAFDGMDYSEVARRNITVDNSKTVGKGFIPGFGGALMAGAVALVLEWVWRKKKG